MTTYINIAGEKSALTTSGEIIFEPGSIIQIDQDNKIEDYKVIETKTLLRKIGKLMETVQEVSLQKQENGQE